MSTDGVFSMRPSTGQYKTRSFVRAFVLISERRLTHIRHLDPLGVGCRAGLVIAVPIPPLVCLCLGIAFRRVLPDLLPPEWGDVEIAPRGAQGFVTAVVGEIGAENPVAVAEEDIV